MNPFHDFHPAKTLSEVAAQTILEALPPGDPRYADLSAGRSGNDLLKLKQFIRNCRDQKRYAVATLTGHRGCGKSTELKRLIEEFRPESQPFYVVVDPTIERTCDYPDLFLWLVDALVRRLDELGQAPNQQIVNEVLDWFTEKYLERTAVKRAEVAAEAKAEAKGGFSYFGLGLKLLARVKSVISGSEESRTVVRRNVEQYADTLIGKINILLGQVEGALKQAGQNGELLIVVDNLDRLEPGAGRRLFIDNGELLKRLNVHMIYTVPIATALAPDRVAKVFDPFTIPTIDPGKKPGREALIQLLAQRIDFDAVFATPKLATDLAKASGGSLRDLIRLLGYAQLEAQVTNGQVMDRPSVRSAINQLREDYKKSLVPAGTYFPLLVRIQQTRGDGLAELAGEDQDKIRAAREFFRELLTNGAVLEYNGEQSHFAVHPVVTQIPAFKNALAKQKDETAGSGKQG